MTVGRSWVFAALLLAACGPANPPMGGTTGSPTISTASPSSSALPGGPGLLYRALSGSEGTQAQRYSLVAAYLDGSNRMILPSTSFAHPDLVRFVQSRNGRWLVWVDGEGLRTAPSANISAAVTVLSTTNAMGALAISEDGGTIAYETSKGSDLTAGIEVHVANVHANTDKLVRSFTGPLISCLADAAFDELAQKLAAIGCGSGGRAGLVVINVIDGSIVSQDDGFGVWPYGVVFARDLATAWLVQDLQSDSDIVRYDTTSRKRQILFHSPPWHQSDGSIAPNLSPVLLLSPDETQLAFGRYPPDRVPEVYIISSAGGTPTMIDKSSRYSRIESWSPDGKYVAISVDASTPTERMLLIDPLTKNVLPVDTGAQFVEFLAWLEP